MRPQIIAAINADLFAFIKAALQDQTIQASAKTISFDMLTTYYAKLVMVESEEEKS